MIKLLLLNGPKESGKGVLTQYIQRHCNVSMYPCKDKLYQLVCDFFMVDPLRFWEIYDDRELKERPMVEFKVTWENAVKLWDIAPKMRLQHDSKGGCNLTIRQAMVYVSELVVKPHFGSDYFGKVRAHKIAGDLYKPGSFLGIDDSTGFEGELPPVIDLLGQESLMLLRVHREGCDYDGDSRGYIPTGVVDNTADIYCKAPMGMAPDMTFNDCNNPWTVYCKEAHTIINEWLMLEELI